MSPTLKFPWHPLSTVYTLVMLHLFPQEINYSKDMFSWQCTITLKMGQALNLLTFDLFDCSRCAFIWLQMITLILLWWVRLALGLLEERVSSDPVFCQNHSQIMRKTNYHQKIMTITGGKNIAVRCWNTTYTCTVCIWLGVDVAWAGYLRLPSCRRTSLISFTSLEFL